MGRIIVSTALSVDGFSSGAGGDLSVMPLDQTFNTHNAELIGGASALLYGATTFRDMVGYWPHQLDNPDPAERSIARRLADGLPVIAVSDTLSAEDTGPWRKQTTLVRRADAHRAVQELRQADGDTVVFGSRTVWADLLSEGLVDVLHLLVGPKLVGGEVSFFAGVPSTELSLLDAKRLPGSSTVLLSYAVG